MRSLEPALVRVVSRHVGAAERDHDRGLAQVEEREHRGGREGEEEVDDVVRPLAQAAPDQRNGSAKIAHRRSHPRLVHADALDPDAMDREQPLALGGAVPEQLAVLTGLFTGGDHLHHHPPARQPARQRFGRDPRTAAERRVLVIEEEDAHGSPRLGG